MPEDASTKRPGDQDEAVVLHSRGNVFSYIILAQGTSLDASIYANFIRAANAFDQASCIRDQESRDKRAFVGQCVGDALFFDVIHRAAWRPSFFSALGPSRARQIQTFGRFVQ